MVLLDVGLNEAALRFASDISDGQWGTGTTDPLVTDTSLETPVADTKNSTLNTSSGNSSQFNHEVKSTEGNGNDLTEYALNFDNDVLLNRTIGGAITKTANFEITTISTISFVRG